MSTPDHHLEGREGRGPQAASQLHVCRGGAGGPGETHWLP